VKNGSPPAGRQDDEFKTLLRRHRVTARMTQEELAELSGVSSRTVRDLERGAVRAPRRRSAEALANALGLSASARETFLDVARSARWSGAAGTERRPQDAPQVVPRQLPADTPTFTGRAHELAVLDAWLALVDGTGTPDRAIAIVGVVGSGKTALAVHWARRHSAEFTDGQLYLDLRGCAGDRAIRPVEALAALLRLLGATSERIPADEDDAARLYRATAAERRMLILLDNVRSAEQVRQLLPGAGRCLAVVTSRDSLGDLVARGSVQPVTLGPLPVPDAVSLLSRLIGARVTTEQQAGAELARLCNHLPLPLCLAAADLVARPHQLVSDYVALLAGADALTEFVLTADGPSETHVVLDQSYTALADAEQRMFRLCGLVPGPDLTVDAAAALMDVPLATAADLLRGLASAHMINHDGSGRLSFHDLIRTYARERAAGAGDDVNSAVARLFDWYLLRTVEAAELGYPESVRLPLSRDRRPEHRFDSRDAALAWLDAERANLVAAVHHAATHGPAQIAWLLLDALRGYLWRNSPVVEWLGCAEVALAAAVSAGAADGLAAIRLGLGQLLLRQGRHAESDEALRGALDAARRAGWSSGEETVLGLLGEIPPVEPPTRRVDGAS
jgi:transcriptional regulator with XRE-family HTH domain